MPRKTKLNSQQQQALVEFYRSEERPSIRDVAAKFEVSYQTAFNVIHRKGAYGAADDRVEQALLFPDGEV